MNENARDFRRREIRLDLLVVVQRILQDPLFDVVADLLRGVLRRGQLVLIRLGLQKLDKICVCQQRRSNLIVGERQSLDLMTGIVPRRDIAAICRPLVENRLRAKVEIGIDVADSIQQNA